MDYSTGVIRVVLGDYETEVDVDEITGIDTQDLTHEFAQQASLLAYVSTLAAEAEAEWNNSKQAFDRAKAEIYQAVRSAMLADGDKVTEARIDAAVVQSRGYVDASVYEADARLQYRILRGLVDAMMAKGSMLQSLGAHLRSELEQTDMVTRVKGIIDGRTPGASR